MKETKTRNRRGVFIVAAVLVLLCGCEEKSEQRTAKKYALQIGGVELCVGNDADDAVARLGQSNSFSSAPSCADIGEDELYVYNGFRLFVYREGENAVIASVELTNDTLPTAEGIYIGDSEQKVLSIYGEGEMIGDIIKYRYDGGELCFFISDGRVRGIRYR